MSQGRVEKDPQRPVYVISVAAMLVAAHPRTLRIYEDEGLICPARTPSNIRLYSDEDIRRITWIRHLTRERGVNLAGIRLLFELEERLGARILEALYAEGTRHRATEAAAAAASAATGAATVAASAKAAATPAAGTTRPPASSGDRPRSDPDDRP